MHYSIKIIPNFTNQNDQSIPKTVYQPHLADRKQFKIELTTI